MYIYIYGYIHIYTWIYAASDKKVHSVCDSSMRNKLVNCASPSVCMLQAQASEPPSPPKSSEFQSPTAPQPANGLRPTSQLVSSVSSILVGTKGIGLG